MPVAKMIQVIWTFASTGVADMQVSIIIDYQDLTVGASCFLQPAAWPELQVFLAGGAGVEGGGGDGFVLSPVLDQARISVAVAFTPVYPEKH